MPSVDAVLLQFEKRRCRLVSERYYALYKDFVIYCREGPNRTIKKALKHLFTYSQLKQISRLLRIDYQASPAELSFMQYLCIFQFYTGHNLKNMASIRGYARKYHQQQANRIKTHRTRKKRGTR